MTTNRPDSQPARTPHGDALNQESWVRRTCGGWPRLLAVVCFVVLSSAAHAGGRIDGGSAAVSAIVTVLAVGAGIAILFAPADPDRGAVASLAFLSGAAVVADVAGGGGIAGSLLVFYVVYEVSAYSSERLRPLLAAWIYLGSAAAVLADRSLVDTYSGHDPLVAGLDVSETKTLLTYVFATVVMWVLLSIPWFVGRMMRGRRRPVAGSTPAV